MISAFDGYQLYGNNLTQSLKRTAAEPALKREQAYYVANIGKVKTVDDFVNNFRLLNYAAKAFGISNMTYAKSLLTKVLKSDLSDSTSFANQLHNSNLVAFARSFNFTATGTLNVSLQTSDQQAATAALYSSKTGQSTTAATSELTSFQAATASLTSLAQIEKSPTALGTILIAYGIDPSSAASTFEPTMESDLSDTASYLNQAGDNGYLALSTAVNVSADGSRTTKQQAQTDANLAAMTSAYTTNAASSTAAQTAAATETTYFISKISTIATVASLVADPRLVAYVQQAFGLPKQASTTDAANAVQAALTSDPTDKKSYINTSPFPAYRALQKSFNFDKIGTAASIPFQTLTQQTATTRLYTARQTTDSATAAAATAYYTVNIGNVHTLSDLQADPKLWSYVGTAYGLDPTMSTSTMASIIGNAAVTDSGYVALAQGFNVNADGSAAAVTVAATNAGIATTTAAYAKNSGSDTASQAAATLETNYFLTKVGGLNTVSDLTSDARLLAYIKTAFKLPASATQATIQSALESNTADPSSYANTSGSAGYVALAKAFNFTATGGAGTANQLISLSQKQTITQLYGERGTTSATAAATETAYFNAKVVNATSVADLTGDSRLMVYIKTAYGLDQTTTSAAITAALENTNNVNSAFLGVSRSYQINADGTRASTAQAQTYIGLTNTLSGYANATPSDSASQQAASSETNYYQAQIGGITSASQLVADDRLVSYLKQAFKLPADASASTIQQALTSDLTKSTSFAKTADPSYLALAQAFTFDNTGAAIVSATIQTSALQNATVKAYALKQTADAATANTETAYYNATIGGVKSVADLVKDSRLLKYIETANGLDPTTPAMNVMSLISSTHGVLDATKNASLLALHQAFNVDAAGNARNAVTAQSSANVTATTAAYSAATASDAASQAAAKTATAYYKAAIANVPSLAGLLNDPKLVAYLEKAYALPTNTKTSVLQQILSSDVSNAKSVAVTMGAKTETMAAAFNFTTTGLIAAETQKAQSKAQLDAVTNAYIEQQMESDASAQNPGIALALYLQTNASKITDAYSILSDQKMVTIFQVLLGLPASSSNANIDTQANTIKAKFNLADLKDPKKVSALAQRFSILYDLNPPASTTPLSGSDILTGTSTTYDSTSVFGSSS